MSLISALASVLNDDVLKAPSADGSLILEEREACMKIDVFNSPISTASISFGRFNHLSVIRGSRLTGRLRKCDYLLIFEKNGKVTAVFIELKKTLKDDAREQLRRSLPFLDYLCSVCEVDCEAEFRKSVTSINYYIIAKRFEDRLDKQRVRVDPQHRIETESYKDITVNSFVGSSISHAALVGV